MNYVHFYYQGLSHENLMLPNVPFSCFPLKRMQVVVCALFPVWVMMSAPVKHKREISVIDESHKGKAYCL